MGIFFLKPQFADLQDPLLVPGSNVAPDVGPGSSARTKEAAALPRQTNAECNFTQPQVYPRVPCGACFSEVVFGRMSDLTDRRGRPKGTGLPRTMMGKRHRDCSVPG